MTQNNPILGTGLTRTDYRLADNAGKQALLNHHKGSAAPSYSEAGIIWLDDSATPWKLKIYDGADWIALGEINASTNAFTAYQGTAPLRLANYAGDTGSADAYAIAPSPAYTAYAAGQVFTVKISNTNTGGATLNVNALGAKNIKMPDGTSPPAGALLAGHVAALMYDGTNMLLLNPALTPIALGGTGASTASAARTNLGLGTAAVQNVGTTANKVVQLDGNGKLPAVDASQLTNLPITGFFSAYFESTVAASSATALQTIPHGLGGVPRLVQVETLVASKYYPFEYGTAANSGGHYMYYDDTNVYFLLQVNSYGSMGLPISSLQVRVKAWR